MCDTDLLPMASASLTSSKAGRALFGRVFSQVLAGLAHCHAAGVYHLDIKPDNLLVVGDGAVKLADWGFTVTPLSARPSKGQLVFLALHPRRSSPRSVVRANMRLRRQCMRHMLMPRLRRYTSEHGSRPRQPERLQQSQRRRRGLGEEEFLAASWTSAVLRSLAAPPGKIVSTHRMQLFPKRVVHLLPLSSSMRRRPTCGVSASRCWSC